MSALRAGFGRREITPPLGAPTCLGVTCFAGEIWDPLYATVLVLDDGRQRAVLIGTDLCGFLQEPDEDIRRAVGQAVGIPADQVVLNVSHTHSGSYIDTEANAMVRPYGLKIVDDDYVALVKQQILAAAGEAADRLTPARLRSGRGHVERVASNRRPKLPNGKTIHRYGRPPEEMRPLAEGLIDPEVQVVQIENLQGQPLGALVNYACHPTAAGGDMHPWITADFVGYGLRPVEAALGGAPCLFLQGTAGNVGTGKWIASTPRGDTEAMGERFAAGVLQALGNLQPIAPGNLWVARQHIPLELEPFPPLAELQQRFEQEVAKGGETRAVERADALIVARRITELRQAPVTTIATGELAISCLPGEVFVEFGLAIKQQSPFRTTLVTAYNDVTLQYIPTASAFPEGAYEVDGGWRYIAPGAGEALAAGAIDQLTATYSLTHPLLHSQE